MTGEATTTAAADLLGRCTFPEPGTSVCCAFSGGADSTALVLLAVAAGCRVTAFHVDHGLRACSRDDAHRAARTAAIIGVPFERAAISVAPGPNLEARARAARRAALPPAHLTGHTADDQAETVLINLMRGAGVEGLAGMTPGPTHPILALRRHETHALCAAAGIDPVRDPSNDDGRFVRNRVRAELLPLLDDIARRDVVAVLARTATVLRDDAGLLTRATDAVDATDVRALARLDPALARRAVRRWLTADGHPPARAAVERVLEVARGRTRACEITGGVRVERSRGRLRIVGATRVASADGEGPDR